jgi:Uma2 family endonuclease
MSAALKLHQAPVRDYFVSVEDYLASELNSPIKHEYVAGSVYAMAGGRNVHNTIKCNTCSRLHFRLRGRPCCACDSDTKIRVRTGNQVHFYYPDTSVTCEPNPPHDSFQDKPVVVFEVLSRSTRRIDLVEKKDVYLTIPSLKVYVVVEQDSPTVVAFRRTDAEFVRETYSGMDAVLPLPEIETELPLADVYERVEFVPEPGDEDEP